MNTIWLNPINSVHLKLKQNLLKAPAFAKPFDKDQVFVCFNNNPQCKNCLNSPAEVIHNLFSLSGVNRLAEKARVQSSLMPIR